MTADLAAITGIKVPTGLFIGGEWTTNGRTIPVTDPATEDTPDRGGQQPDHVTRC